MSFAPTPRAARRLSALVLGLSLAGLAAAACGIPASEAGTAAAAAGVTLAGGSSGPVRCELVLTETRGSTSIEGRVAADRAVRGTWRMTIAARSAGGRSTIAQSGDFSVGPGAPAVLGQTTLGGSRAQYRAELELTVPGERISCRHGAAAQDL